MLKITQALTQIQPIDDWQNSANFAINQSKIKRFEALVLPHLDAAYNLARWLTRNDHDAQDISQEASLRAFKFLDGFHGEKARAWLLTIVHNAYYTWLQKKREREHDETFDEESHNHAGEDSTWSVDVPDCDPERLLMQQVSKQIINKALEQLPMECREVIVLRELEDLSYKEIADIVNIPMGTVMSRLARARKLLREQLVRMNAQSQI